MKKGYNKNKVNDTFEFGTKASEESGTVRNSLFSSEASYDKTD